jgi:hypothetical protein
MTQSERPRFLGLAALAATLALAALASTREPQVILTSQAGAHVQTKTRAQRHLAPAPRPISDADEIVGHPDDGIVALPAPRFARGHDLHELRGERWPRS